jgi:hypothetical protein
MFQLPTHPFTGLTAIGLGKRGPIWPVMGGDGTAEADTDADTSEAPGNKAGDDAGAEQLGDAGKQALDRMKAERAAARKELKDAQAKLAQYEKAEQDKADADKSEAEKRTAAEARADAAELRALRIEVAHEKGLTPAQAKRLVGANREELEKDADEILVDFPVAPVKSTPKPDPSQGPRGDTKTRPTSLGQAVSTALKPKA